MLSLNDTYAFERCSHSIAYTRLSFEKERATHLARLKSLELANCESSGTSPASSSCPTSTKADEYTMLTCLLLPRLTRLSRISVSPEFDALDSTAAQIQNRRDQATAMAVEHRRMVVESNARSRDFSTLVGKFGLRDKGPVPNRSKYYMYPYELEATQTDLASHGLDQSKLTLVCYLDPIMRLAKAS